MKVMFCSFTDSKQRKVHKLDMICFKNQVLLPYMITRDLEYPWRDCCGACEQQHKQDWKRIYIEGGTNYQNALHLTRVHCATFYQSALHYKELEDFTTDVTRPSRRPFLRGF